MTDNKNLFAIAEELYLELNFDLASAYYEQAAQQFEKIGSNVDAIAAYKKLRECFIELEKPSEVKNVNVHIDRLEKK